MITNILLKINLFNHFLFMHFNLKKIMTIMEKYMNLNPIQKTGENYCFF